MSPQLAYSAQSTSYAQSETVDLRFHEGNDMERNHRRPRSQRNPQLSSSVTTASTQQTISAGNNAKSGVHKRDWSHAELHHSSDAHPSKYMALWDSSEHGALSPTPHRPVVRYPQSAFEASPSSSQKPHTKHEFLNCLEAQTISSSVCDSSGIDRETKTYLVEPPTWGYSSDNRESLARNSRAIENTLRLVTLYADPPETTKRTMPRFQSQHSVDRT
ncbi:hypothetical protein F5880DRAFT_294547 [Lentinula raphanica]|nr:hypothetical protein F5880DRAFT_294547 [Lentinula raphanica]